MFTRKSSRSGVNQQRIWTDLLYQAGGTKILTEVRYASKSSGTLKRRTIFSVQPVYVCPSRIGEGPREKKETGRRREEAHSQQAVTTRRNADSSGGWWEAKRSLALIFGSVLLTVLAGCRSGDKPKSTWNELYSSGTVLLELGDKDSLAAAQSKAEQGFRESVASDPVWNWKFRILKAEVLVWRGKAADVLALLSVGPPAELSKSEFVVRAKLAQGYSYLGLGKYDDAKRSFGDAAELASAAAPFLLAQVALYKGVLAHRLENYAAAEQQFLKALQLARQQGNHFIETGALSNLGLVSTRTN